MQSLNEAEKAENFKIIDNMSKKITFLKNPRFKVTKAPIMMTDVSHSNNCRRNKLNCIGWFRLNYRSEKSLQSRATSSLIC